MKCLLKLLSILAYERLDLGMRLVSKMERETHGVKEIILNVTGKTPESGQGTQDLYARKEGGTGCRLDVAVTWVFFNFIAAQLTCCGLIK